MVDWADWQTGWQAGRPGRLGDAWGVYESNVAGRDATAVLEPGTAVRIVVS